MKGPGVRVGVWVGRSGPGTEDQVLVLTRRAGETIMIGDVDQPEKAAISISIVEIDGGKISLGIEAPADIAVHRLEVWRQIVAERRRTGGGPRGAS